ncbi:MAG TPA: UDP-N-acetylglucosamine 2-epimerase (non-hydrolyzing) [Bacteroidales bacterium]|nr:UDP-N-acetylglucosamine 2-epimerase (non-hydrolyzing) [Bacteroidales bacterium]
MNITLIAGARPNFMKIAPIIHAIKNTDVSHNKISYRLVHTGQHYDRNMSDSFFEDLNIPEPHVNLGCNGGTQAEQTASIMVAFEKELSSNPTDIVMVVGDVTSTMACSIVAKKLNTKVAHVEAGIRSFDLTMPEEINRMVTDCLTDYFFTTSETANENLKKLGVPDIRIFFVGNVMIDTLMTNRKRFRKPVFFDELQLKDQGYLVLTLHRPSNVDEEAKLKDLLYAIINTSEGIPVIFPVHPRTAKIISGFGLNDISHFSDTLSLSSKPDSVRPVKNLYLTEPLGYLEFNYLVEKSKAVITDSGGITEETTVMGIPCITLRDTTERPETVTAGTNELIGTDPAAIKPVMGRLFAGEWKKGGIPELWDGHTAERIIRILNSL